MKAKVLVAISMVALNVISFSPCEAYVEDISVKTVHYNQSTQSNDPRMTKAEYAEWEMYRFISDIKKDTKPSELVAFLGQPCRIKKWDSTTVYNWDVGGPGWVTVVYVNGKVVRVENPLAVVLANWDYKVSLHKVYNTANHGAVNKIKKGMTLEQLNNILGREGWKYVFDPSGKGECSYIWKGYAESIQVFLNNGIVSHIMVK